MPMLPRIQPKKQTTRTKIGTEISNTLKPKNAKTEKVKPKKFNQLQKFIFTNIAIENNQKSTEIILQPKSLLRFSFLQSKNSNRS